MTVDRKSEPGSKDIRATSHYEFAHEPTRACEHNGEITPKRTRRSVARPFGIRDHGCVMTTSDPLREQLIRFLDWPEAHADFAAAIDGIPPDKRGTTPAGLPHSAWQLLEHL